MTTALYWELDTRLGRRWNVDPMTAKAPDWTPYRAFFNNPITFTDPLGLFETKRQAKRYNRKNKIKGEIRKGTDTNFEIVDKDGITYSKGDDSNLHSTDKHDNDGVVEGYGGGNKPAAQEKRSSFGKGFKGVGLGHFNFGGGTSRNGLFYRDKSNPFYDDWIRSSKKWDNFGKTTFYGGLAAAAATPAIAFGIITAPVWAPPLINLAKGYHNFIGMRGGYVNGALNWLNQSYTQGGNISNYFSLEGKSITGLIMASGLTYGTSLGGQLAIGAADPWLSVNYSKNGLYMKGVYQQGITSTMIQSVIGVAGAMYLQAPLSKSEFMNFIMEQGLFAPGQKALQDEK